LFLFGAAFQALVFVVLSRIDDHPTPLVAPAGVRESE
jgi:hypothetical protein